METWGCEFIDTTDRQPPDPKEIWRTNPQAIELPIFLVFNLTDRQRLAEVKQDTARIFLLETSIKANGLFETGVIHISPTSTKLYEGHHRLIACYNLGKQYFPVQIKEATVKGGISNQTLIKYLLKEINGCSKEKDRNHISIFR